MVVAPDFVKTEYLKFWLLFLKKNTQLKVQIHIISAHLEFLKNHYVRI